MKIMGGSVIETESEKLMRQEIAGMIGIELSEPALNVEYEVLGFVQENGYTRHCIEYDSYEIK